MKVTLYIAGALITVVVVGIAWAQMVRPDLDRIRERAEEQYTVSEISYPENYSELARKEVEAGESFLTKDAVHSAVYKQRFPFSKTNLDNQKTKALLEMLSDSSSYRWGEAGTPDYELVIVYYGKNEEEIGYTLIDPVGEVENCPYRSVMKWGMLTDAGYEKLVDELAAP